MSAAFDDERDEYTAPGHTAPLTLLPSAGDVAGCPNCARIQAELDLIRSGACEHTFELQALRNTIENLRAENDNLSSERDSLKIRLELVDDGD